MQNNRTYLTVQPYRLGPRATASLLLYLQAPLQVAVGLSLEDNHATQFWHVYSLSVRGAPPSAMRKRLQFCVVRNFGMCIFCMSVRGAPPPLPLLQRGSDDNVASKQVRKPILTMHCLQVHLSNHREFAQVSLKR